MNVILCSVNPPKKGYLIGLSNTLENQIKQIIKQKNIIELSNTLENQIKPTTEDPSVL